MLPPEVDLENRRPVWEEMSRLFLDTELDSDDIDGIASALAESSYSCNELDKILRCEVAPLVGVNLFSTAGNWTAFDREWLESEILRREKKWFPWYRIFNFSRLVKKDWQLILQQIKLKRAE